MSVEFYGYAVPNIDFNNGKTDYRPWDLTKVRELNCNDKPSFTKYEDSKMERLTIDRSFLFEEKGD